VTCRNQAKEIVAVEKQVVLLRSPTDSASNGGAEAARGIASSPLGTKPARSSPALRTVRFPDYHPVCGIPAEGQRFFHILSIREYIVAVAVLLRWNLDVPRCFTATSPAAFCLQLMETEKNNCETWHVVTLEIR
jgi:hypothetical protein